LDAISVPDLSSLAFLPIFLLRCPHVLSHMSDFSTPQLENLGNLKISDTAKPSQRGRIRYPVG
jgi:hypothetical protein